MATRKKATAKITRLKEKSRESVTYKASAIAAVMNFAVSGYVYFVAFMLVVFMVSSLVAGVISLVNGLLELSTTSGGLFATDDRLVLELSLLHTIAFTIVLVKAYKILIAFADTRHINLKFLVEIAIIAPTIELIFNTGAYELETRVLFAAFAVINLITYLFFYKTLKQVSDDYIRECHRSPS